MKRAHGEPLQLWEKHGLKSIPPIPCDFKLDEHVIFTNDNGVSFDCKIIGFAENTEFQGRFIHHIPINGTWNDAGWFPGKPEQFSKVQS